MTLKHILLTAAFIAAFLLQITSPAHGQGQCAERSSAIAHLMLKYNEQVVHSGLTVSGSLLEVTASGDGRTWSIIISSPSGVSCIVASGENWADVKTDVVPGEDS